MASDTTISSNQQPEEAGQKVILCLDDEPSLLQALKRVFYQYDYKLLLASNAEEAMQMMQAQRVHLVISDQRMPGMNGTEFLAEIKEKYPDTFRIILTGYSDPQIVLDAIVQGDCHRFLTKPWQEEELLSAIQECLGPLPATQP